MLEAKNLVCARGGRELLRGLSLELRGGELLRIAGANGAGKTTLLKILCGLLAPDAGAVHWRGAPIRTLREEYSRQVVYLGHAPAVKDDLSAAENLLVACALAGQRPTATGVHEALARFGLPDGDVPVRRLSQGQRRRAALARLALSAAVPLWLLDEPLAALDADAVQLMQTLIAGHVAAGRAVIYTTHQDASIAAAAQRVLELR